MMDAGERRVVTALMTLTVESGPPKVMESAKRFGFKDELTPGNQFTVLGISGDRVTVQRGLGKGHVRLDDLNTCTKIVPPF